MKNLMRWLGWITVFGSSVAYAAPAGEANSLSLLVYLFLAVIALIVCTQVIPVCVLLFGMTKNSFFAKGKKEEDKEEVRS
jgi:predicted membrane channel-forming protein YqfA (hemolysin III family)